MMLRASVQMTGEKIDMKVVTGKEVTSGNSIPDGDTLVAFVEAAVSQNEVALLKARSEVIEKMGEGALIDAAALVGNFQMMVRIANSTGIPLDTPMAALSTDLQKELSLNGFESSDNTPDAGFLQRAAGKVFGPIVMGCLKFLGERRKPG